mmetsp:Transcript_22009/g.18868  ORF Transcript_22009/g.18868 Transcript_22009/m.18868 type:complete len:126 (+) Transcript_22009:303-680(+)|eukprot:CAMPEP_0114584456 /NCGR_PEP_ID=MMETSP0125-20121206/8142_1 /TAXON_ID=485358 ORGANISM="Aristerostoma sp., Strain ATCC 50986" /NCGR_SAMPLE_ID=MMETSP0125 /ASSEMBLY_ACC=CAM_ASM_000245 /LENGTH=125 /DNA_ID=CAMNT_0001778837 /DNA_START=233 /DNA_END=610 /DNA_ORIENTATION=+
MKIYWNGLYGSSEAFWQHEWEAHGSCWKDTVGSNPEEDFFSTAIATAKKADIYSTLANKGITPGNKYDSKDIINAIHGAFGYSTFLCDNGKLKAIRICIDLNGGYIDCENASNSCYNEVEYPAWA